MIVVLLADKTRRARGTQWSTRLNYLKQLKGPKSLKGLFQIGCRAKKKPYPDPLEHLQ